MQEEIALVYMVAGLSSRFGGRIKQLVRVTDNETLIEYSMNQAIKAGFSKIIFIVGDMTEKPFKEKFGNNYKGISIYYARQEFDKNKRDKPWGTMDAICSAKHLLDCNFVLCNGDDIYGEESFKILFNHLKNNQTSAIMGYKLKNILPESGEVCRAIINTENNQVKSIKEDLHVSRSNLKQKGYEENTIVSMNILGLIPSDLEKLNKKLIKFKEKHQGDRKIECLLPDEIGKLIEENQIKMSVYTTDSKWFGITNPEDEEILRNKLKNTEN